MRADKGDLMALELENLSSKRLDHLGIVAQVCREIQLSSEIDRLLGIDSRQKVTGGEAVVAMILNALGFVDRPLYLFPEFFRTKPVDLLIREGLTPEMFNDDVLGRTLDKLFTRGLEEIFLNVAVKAYQGEELGGFFHHDTTSWTVHGKYDPEGDAQDDIPISITYGHAKNGRKDLKQFMVSLITAQDLPVFIQALSGNTSDTPHFREVAQQYGQRLQNVWNTERIWVWDSKFYTKNNIQVISDQYKWITRVPETLTDAKDVLEQIETEQMRRCTILDGYRLHSVETDYAGVAQRWVVVFSDKAFTREQATLNRQVTKELDQAEKQVWHLGNQEFAALEDAQKAAEALEKKWKYHRIDQRIVDERSKRANGQQGRPRRDEQLVTVYKLQCTVRENQPAIDRALLRKGKFIIASNELDPTQYSDETLLTAYKDQQHAERGFRFLKDPGFFTPGIFLKTESRIMALVMIMGLALMVYSLAQRYLRRALTAQNEPFPDPERKPNHRPTMKRIFQLFEGISVLYQEDQPLTILGLTSLHKYTLQLLGPQYEARYHLIPG